MPNNPAQNTIYESYKMLHPDGTFMVYCSKKKAEWYVSRGLGTWEGEKTFRLKFEPQGYGKNGNPYYMQTLKNQCVVCGTTEELNKHHVFPYVFKSRLPAEYKESSHHDILPICTDCHENYEEHANRLKTKLSQDYNAPMHHKMSDQERNNRKIISAQHLLEKINKGELKDKNGNTVHLSAEKLEEIKKQASEKANETMMPQENPNSTEWADIIMDNVMKKQQLQSFVELWRSHFIEYAEPKFLPEHWHVNSPIEQVKKI